MADLYKFFRFVLVGVTFLGLSTAEILKVCASEDDPSKHLESKKGDYSEKKARKVETTEPQEQRERERKARIHREREREKEAESEKERRTREKVQAREQNDYQREREHERDRPREREHERDRPREREHERDRTREREQERDRPREREHERDRPREREHERDRPREREHERDRPREREHERDRPREREHERDRPREREQERDRPREREHERDRPREREYERDRPREREQEKERLAGYSHEEIKSNQPLLQEVARRIVHERSVIDALQVTLRQKHSQAAYNLWRQYNDNANFPQLDALPNLIRSIDSFNRDVVSGRNIDGNLRKWLRTMVGKKGFTLFTEETIRDIEGNLLRAIDRPTRIYLGLPTLGGNEETVIYVTYTLDNPIGLLYEKENGKALDIRLIKDGEPKREIIVAIDAQPYLQELMRNKEALNTGRFLGGTILTVNVQ